MNASHDFLLSSRTQRGFSLVEIMVALLIGLFLMGGIIQILLGTKQTYRFHEALSRIQENGRFAMEFFSHDIRMAGFTGCPRTNPIANVLNNPTDWWKDFSAGAVMGYDGNQDFPGRAFGTSPGNRIAGTDAVTFLRGGGNDYSIVSHNPTAAEFKLNQLHTLQDGSIVMVCDTQQTSILQLTNVNSSGLGSPVVCTATGTGYRYGPESTMVDFIPTAFYIGVSASGNSRSLYRFRPQVNTGTVATVVAEELVEGVENMQVFYGVDVNGDNLVDPAYVDANSVVNWNRVLSVRVNLLLASPENNLNTANQWVMFPSSDTGNANTVGNGFAASDRRLYQVFSSTVALRNRLP